MPLNERQEKLFEFYRAIQAGLNDAWEHDNIKNIYQNLISIISLYHADNDPMNKILEDLSEAIETIAKEKEVDISEKVLSLAKKTLKGMMNTIENKSEPDAISMLESEYFIRPILKAFEQELQYIMIEYEKGFKQRFDPTIAEPFETCEDKIKEMKILLKKIEVWLEKEKINSELTESAELIQHGANAFSKTIAHIEFKIGKYKFNKNDFAVLEEQLASGSEDVFCRAIVSFIQKHGITEQELPSLKQYLEAKQVQNIYEFMSGGVSDPGGIVSVYREFYSRIRKEFFNSIVILDGSRNDVSLENVKLNTYNNAQIRACYKELIYKLPPDKIQAVTNLFGALNELYVEINDNREKIVQDSINLLELNVRLQAISGDLAILFRRAEVLEEVVKFKGLKDENSGQVDELKQKFETITTTIQKLNRAIKGETQAHRSNVENVKNDIKIFKDENNNLLRQCHKQLDNIKLDLKKHAENKDTFNKSIEDFNSNVQKTREDKTNLAHNLDELDKLLQEISQYESEKFPEAENVQTFSSRIKDFISTVEVEMDHLKIEALREKGSFIETLAPEYLAKFNKMGVRLKELSSTLNQNKEREEFITKSPIAPNEGTKKEKIRSTVAEKYDPYDELTVQDLQKLEFAIENDSKEVLANLIKEVLLTVTPIDMDALLKKIEGLVIRSKKEQNILLTTSELEAKMLFFENIFKSVHPNKNLGDLERWQAFYYFNSVDNEGEFLAIEKSLNELGSGTRIDRTRKKVLETIQGNATNTYQQLGAISGNVGGNRNSVNQILDLKAVSSVKTKEHLEQLLAMESTNHNKRKNLEKIRMDFLEKLSNIHKNIKDLYKQKERLYKDYIESEIERKKEISILLKNIKELESKETELKDELEYYLSEYKQELDKEKSVLNSETEKNTELTGYIDTIKELEDKLNTSMLEVEGKISLLNKNSDTLEEMQPKIAQYRQNIEFFIKEIKEKLELIRSVATTEKLHEMDLDKVIGTKSELDIEEILQGFSKIKDQTTLEELNILSKEIENILKKAWPIDSLYAETFPVQLNESLEVQPTELIESKDALEMYFRKKIKDQEDKILRKEQELMTSKINDALKNAEQFVTILQEIAEKGSKEELETTSVLKDKILEEVEGNEFSRKPFLEFIHKKLNRKFSTLQEVNIMYNKANEEQKSLLDTAQQYAKTLSLIIASIKDTRDEKVLHNDIKHRLLDINYANLTTEGAKRKFLIEINQGLKNANLLPEGVEIKDVEDIKQLTDKLISERQKILNEEKASKAAKNISAVFSDMLKITLKSFPVPAKARDLENITDTITSKFKEKVEEFQQAIHTVPKEVEAYFGRVLKEELDKKKLAQVNEAERSRLTIGAGENSNEIVAPSTVKDVEILWKNTQEYNVGLLIKAHTDLKDLNAEIRKKGQELDQKAEARGKELAKNYITFVQQIKDQSTIRNVEKTKETYNQQFNSLKIPEENGSLVVDTMLAVINEANLGFKVTEKNEVFERYADVEKEKKAALEEAVKLKANAIEAISKYPRCSNELEVTEVTNSINRVLIEDPIFQDPTNWHEREILRKELQRIYVQPDIVVGKVEFKTYANIGEHIEALDKLYKTQLALAGDIAKAIESQLQKIPDVQESNMQDLSNEIPHAVEASLTNITSFTKGAKGFFS